MGRRRSIRVVGSLLAVTIVAGTVTLATPEAEGLGLPSLTSISITPATASIVQGQTQQFTATGLFSNGTLQDLTSELTWAVSTVSGSAASLSSSGLATGVAPGVSTITAATPLSLLGSLGILSPLTSSASTLTVLPALQSFTVSPSSLSLIPGTTQQLTATGLFSDGSLQNITNDLSWSSASGALASVSGTGLVTGLVPGVDTVTALAPAGLLSGPLAGLLTPLSQLTTVTVVPAAFSMSPSSGKRRTHVTASGTNFTPGKTVVVTYLSGVKAKKRARSVLCSAPVASNGSFSCAGVIPRSGGLAGKAGKHTVTAAVVGGTTGSSVFTLLRGLAKQATANKKGTAKR